MKEAKQCHFNAEDITIRSQIITGLKNSTTCKDALKKSWDLAIVQKEGMKMESDVRSGVEISSVLTVSKTGKYLLEALNKSKELATV